MWNPFAPKPKPIDVEAICADYDSLDVGKDIRHVHLVLSGSGIKFYSFLAAVYVLHLAGYVVTSVTGTSGGAIVAAAIARFYDPNASRTERAYALKRMMKLALGVDIPKLLDPELGIWNLAFGKSGAIKGNKILNKLRKELPATFAELKIPCTVVVNQVNLKDPRTQFLTSGDLPLAVRASMSIPFLFSPVQYGNMLLVDGGWQMNLPLPEGGENVVALTLDTGTNDNPEIVPNNVVLGMKLIDGAIDEGMRRAIEAAPEAEVFKIVTTLGGLDFFANDEKKILAMVEGAESIKDAIWEKV